MNELPPIDPSQDLIGPPDERDRGYGIDVDPDGELRQRDPDEDEPPTDEAS